MNEQNRQMPRRSWARVIALLGLLWVIAVLAAYVAGYFYQVTWTRDEPTRSDIVSVGEGYVLEYSFSNAPIPGAVANQRWEVVSRSASPQGFKGFLWWFESRPQQRGTAYVIPLWAVAVPGALLVLAGFGLARRKGRGRCPKCGYDVRGLTHAACPSCGRTLGV